MCYISFAFLIIFSLINFLVTEDICIVSGLIIKKALNFYFVISFYQQKQWSILLCYMMKSASML